MWLLNHLKWLNQFVASISSYTYAINQHYSFIGLDLTYYWFNVGNYLWHVQVFLTTSYKWNESNCVSMFIQPNAKKQLHASVHSWYKAPIFGKILQIHKFIAFSMEYFTAALLQFSSANVRVCLLGDRLDNGPQFQVLHGFFFVEIS